MIRTLALSGFELCVSVFSVVNYRVKKMNHRDTETQSKKQAPVRILSLSLLLAVNGLAVAAPAKLRPEIMGVSLDMSRAEAQAHLQAIGKLQKEDRKRQEVWALNDPRVSHLLVGYDADYRVRYVTAIARADGPRIRYQEIADVKNARRLTSQGNYRFTWEVAARSGHSGYFVIAHGRDPEYLETYSVKKLDQEEVD
jgi:hypothetical protein